VPTVNEPTTSTQQCATPKFSRIGQVGKGTAVFLMFVVAAVVAVRLTTHFADNTDEIAIAERERAAAQNASQESRRQWLEDRAQSDVEELLEKAQLALDAGDIEAAVEKIERALTVSNARNLEAAKRLDRQIRVATDAGSFRDALMDVSDAEFERLKTEGVIPEQINSHYLALNRSIEQLADAEVENVAEAREQRRLVRLQEEEEKRLKELEIAKKKLEKEQEIDVKGLAYLGHTVGVLAKGLGGGIVGDVENRTGRKLKYARITFNLYDSSGARVGTATDEITGLEVGEIWRFRAVPFGSLLLLATEYKFADLEQR
jgi:tetratricopeptide (TPR) repeat protein